MNGYGIRIRHFRIRNIFVHVKDDDPRSAHAIECSIVCVCVSIHSQQTMKKGDFCNRTKPCEESWFSPLLLKRNLGQLHEMLDKGTNTRESNHLHLHPCYPHLPTQPTQPTQVLVVLGPGRAAGIRLFTIFGRRAVGKEHNCNLVRTSGIGSANVAYW